MYLWKYWRESRILFAVSLLGIAVLTIAMLHEDFGKANYPQNPSVPEGLWPIFLYIQILPLCFIAWIFGSFGAGRDLGEGSGSFIFSRPRNWRFFIWRDWGFGLLQVLVIAICLNLALWLQMHRILVATGDPYHGSIYFAKGTIPLRSLVGLTVVNAFLLAALVFSLTYCSTILVRNARGVFLSAGVLLGYFILGIVVKHYYAAELPPLLLREFTYMNRTVYGVSDHLLSSMLIRAGLLLPFPLAAQFLLARTDI